MPIYEVTLKFGPGRLLVGGLGKIERRTFKAVSYADMLRQVKEYGESRWRNVSWKLIDFTELTQPKTTQER